MCKRCSNIFIWVKKDLFGCVRIEEIRDKDNATGLKEGGEIEMSIYSAFHIRDARSLSLLYLLTDVAVFVFFFFPLFVERVESIMPCCNVHKMGSNSSMEYDAKDSRHFNRLAILTFDLNPAALPLFLSFTMFSNNWAFKEEEERKKKFFENINDLL